MIGKYRNQAIIRIASGFALLFVSLIVVFAAERMPYWHLGLGISIIAGICGYITYVPRAACVGEGEGVFQRAGYRYGRAGFCVRFRVVVPVAAGGLAVLKTREEGVSLATTSARRRS